MTLWLRLAHLEGICGGLHSATPADIPIKTLARDVDPIERLKANPSRILKRLAERHLAAKKSSSNILGIPNIGLKRIHLSAGLVTKRSPEISQLALLSNCACN